MSERVPKSHSIDASLRGLSGNNAVCGWSVVQLDYDGDQEPCISAAVVAEMEVQRTTRRAELLVS